MAMIRLNFPALLEQEGRNYILRPLLNKGPTTKHERYNRLVANMKKAVKEIFQHEIVNTSIQESLLWFKFSPEIQFENLKLNFRSGMYQIDGRFSMAQFRVNGQRYICFPKLNYLTLRVPVEVKHRPALVNFAHDKVAKYFREEKKELQDEFDPKVYYSHESASTIDISLSCEMKNDQFNFEVSLEQLWSFLGNNREFDGATELEKVAEDVSEEEGTIHDQCLFRDEEVAWVKRALFTETPQAVVVVGDKGVGKSNVIQEALNQYLQDYANISHHQLKKLWLLDPLRVISGMSIVGQWERRFESILTRIKTRLLEITEKENPDILYVDNPLALLRIGKTAQTSLTLANVLMPMLDRRDFPVVLEARPEEWQKVQELNRSFADMFQVLRLKSLSAPQVDQVMSHKRASLELRFQCEFSMASLITLKKIEPRFRGVQVLPGSLTRIMGDIAVKSTNKKITEAWVYRSIQDNFNINEKIIDRDAILKREEVEAYFREKLIGQADARQVLVDTILTIKANLCMPGKPLNTLLFIGPTGVGKTGAVKLLANYLYTREECLVRIDMNEFIDEDAVARLVGDVGRPSGILTERVRYQKSCVLLLDEIEKAHPSVHDILLQLLDDGRLTDASGNTTDFTQCVVVLTSNVGAQEASSNMGFVHSDADMKASYLKSLEKSFRPELINRINNIVVFDALKLSDMVFLAELHLKRLLGRDGFVRRSTILNVDPACLEFLAKKGFDPKLGARALKRNLENLVTRATASQLAEINTDDPVVLNMWLENEEAKSDLVRLSYTDTLQEPVPKEVDYELEDYDNIKTCLAHLEDKLRHIKQNSENFVEKQRELEYLLWTLSDAVRDVKEPLQSFIYELEERLATKNLQVKFSFAGIKNRSVTYYRSPRVEIKTLHAVHDIKEYLASLYLQAGPYFKSDRGNQISLWSEVNRLDHYARCVDERGIDRCIIVIKSLVASRGVEGVNYLRDVYKHLLSQLSRVELLEFVDGAIAMKVTGAGLFEPLEYESGIHLFYEDDGAQVPVVFGVFKEERFDRDLMFSSLELLRRSSAEILRVYALDTKNNHKDATITDLRTQLMTNYLKAEAENGWWNFLIPAFRDVLGEK